VRIVSVLLEMHLEHNANWHYILILHDPVGCVRLHVANQVHHAHFLLLFEVILHRRYTLGVEHAFGLVLFFFSV